MKGEKDMETFQEHLVSSDAQQNGEDLMLLSRVWKTVKRLWPVLLLLLLAVSIGYTAISWAMHEPRYTAEASFVISSAREETDDAAQDDLLTQVRYTFPYLLASEMLQKQVFLDLQLNGTPEVLQQASVGDRNRFLVSIQSEEGEVLGQYTLSTQAVEDTNLFTVSVTTNDPDFTQRILRSLMENYPATAASVIGNTEILPMGAVNVSDEPDEPFRLLQTWIMGAFLGLLAGSLVIAGSVWLRRTILSANDLTQKVHAPCLGALISVREKKRSHAQNHSLLSLAKDCPPAYQEAIRTVRARLEVQAQKQQSKVFLVTSALPEEGKTTLAINLALSMKQQRKRVLLLDAALRQPSICGLLHLSNHSGLLEYLQGQVSAKEAIRVVDGMDCMAGCTSMDDPVVLLQSKRLTELFEWVKERYDYIIVDASDASTVSDVAILAAAADAVLLVVRQDYAAQNQVMQAIQTLAESHTPLIGFVLNMVKSVPFERGYGYGKYGYGYGYGKKNAGYGYGTASKKSKIVYDQQIQNAQNLDLQELGIPSDVFIQRAGTPEWFEEEQESFDDSALFSAHPKEEPSKHTAVRTFCVASVCFQIRLEHPADWFHCMDAFEIFDTGAKPVMNYRIEWVQDLPAQRGTIVSESKRQTVTNVDGMECRLFHNVDGLGRALLVETATDQATLYLDQQTWENVCREKQLWRYLALERLLAGEQRVVLRAAHLLDQGRSVLVLASSGKEFCTFAKKFANIRKATLLNERYAVLYQQNGQWIACGTPMNRSNGTCPNKCAPLAAVLNVCHGSESGLFPMTLVRRNRRLEEEIQWNCWNDGYIRFLLPKVQQLIRAVPFYDAYWTSNDADLSVIDREFSRLQMDQGKEKGNAHG